MFTDGACRGNPGPGGWAVLLRMGAKERELSGGEALTTNNRMELMAAIRGLEALKRPCRVRLHTDSIYVRDGITRWIHNGSAMAGARPTGSRSRMPSCGRSWSTPPRRTGSNGIGSKATAAIPRTTGSTRSPAPRPTISAPPPPVN